MTVKAYKLKKSQHGLAPGSTVYASDAVNAPDAGDLLVTIDPQGNGDHFTVHADNLRYIGIYDPGPVGRLESPQAYVTKYPNTYDGIPAGTTVYRAVDTFRGMSRNEANRLTHRTGKEYVVVTASPDGQPTATRPPFVVPLSDLEPVATVHTPYEIDGAKNTTEAAASEQLQQKHVWDTPDGRAPAIREIKGRQMFNIGIGEAIALQMAMHARPVENGWLGNLGGLRVDVHPLTAHTVSVRVYHEATGDGATFTITTKE